MSNKIFVRKFWCYLPPSEGPKCEDCSQSGEYHWGKKLYVHHKNVLEFNWCNAMQYITSWEWLVDLMQQFWPCSSRVVKTWCNPLQHWNQTEFYLMQRDAIQHITKIEAILICNVFRPNANLKNWCFWGAEGPNCVDKWICRHLSLMVGLWGTHITRTSTSPESAGRLSACSVDHRKREGEGERERERERERGQVFWASGVTPHPRQEHPSYGIGSLYSSSYSRRNLVFTILAIPATIYRSAKGPGPESATKSAVWVVVGTWFRVPQRALRKLLFGILGPQKLPKSSPWSALWGTPSQVPTVTWRALIEALSGPGPWALL